jgi:hypothetical protein
MPRSCERQKIDYLWLLWTASSTCCMVSSEREECLLTSNKQHLWDDQTHNQFLQIFIPYSLHSSLQEHHEHNNVSNIFALAQHFHHNTLCSNVQDAISQLISVNCLTTDWTTGVRSTAEAKTFSFSSSLCVQTSSEIHPDSYPMGTGVLFQRVKHGRGMTLITHPHLHSVTYNRIFTPPSLL